MWKGITFAIMAILAIHDNNIIMVDAGYCSTRSCEGRSENSCNDAYGCQTYEKCTSTGGQYGSVDTITSTCSRHCTTGGFQSCFKDFKSSSACNTVSNCKWVGDEEEEDNNQDEENVTSIAECQSIEISAGCEGTDMGSIVGTYKPLTTSRCSGRSTYMSEDGSMTMIYDDNSDRWEIGYVCNEDTCSCLEPKVVSVRLQFLTKNTVKKNK